MSSSPAPASPVSPPAPKGVQHPGIIDLLAHDPATDSVTLVLAEFRPWSGSDEQLFQLQEKLNAYVSFALDGELEETYPALAGRPVRLRLECREEPDPRTAGFLAMVRHQISFQGLELDVVPGDEGCGSPHCGCH